ncbi:MAG: PulJ/GspJ family protein [Dongiaceae bacterium]
MHHRAPLAAEQGFTLVELLVGLILMALISVILFGGLRFGMRAWEAGSDHIDDATRIELVQNLLRRQVSQARLPPQAADTGPVAAFVGGADSLMFIAPLPAHRGRGGSYLFRLTQRESDRRSVLTLAWHLYRPELLAEDLAAPEDETALLEDIAGIGLAYYGAADPERPPQWSDAWDGAGGRPQLVRLRVEFPPGDARRWPDLIIRVVGASN